MTKSLPIDNPAKRKLAAGGFVLCMTLRQLTTADAPLILRTCGFDAFYVDWEHSTITQAATSQLCITAAALGLTPLVRVRSGSSADISSALDGGALGVIVPHVSNRAEAEAAVHHAKFRPLGARSIAALSPVTGYRALTLADSVALQNDATLVIVMLETEDGIRNVDAIAAVPGVDVMMIGSTDLSAELGIPGQTRHPRILDAYAKMAEAARRHGKHFVGGGSGGPELPHVIRLGARILMGSTDVSYFITAARQAAATMQAAIPSTEQPSAEVDDG